MLSKCSITELHFSLTYSRDYSLYVVLGYTESEFIVKWSIIVVKLVTKACLIAHRGGKWI